MKIKIATITGADNKTSITDMLEISKRFPFVEWGILFSPKRNKIGSPRYPTLDWVSELRKVVTYNNFPNMEFFDKNKDSFRGNWFKEWQKSVIKNDKTVLVSAHICGEYTKEILEGKYDLLREQIQPFISHLFLNRAQWNFNASKHTVSEDFYPCVNNYLNGNTIIQYNRNNAEVCRRIIEFGNQRIQFLYDSSGGVGILPNSYDPPIGKFFTGYAGGLTPDNLQDHLNKIEQVCGDKEIWIDAETGVRTNDVLDLDKVNRFLEIASKYN